MPSASPISVSVRPAQIEQAIPVGVVARQARDLEAEHDADVGERDLGGQAREADRATTPEPERPRSSSMTTMRSSGQPSSCGLGRERILAVGGFAIVLDLGGARLAQIDDGLARRDGWR